MGIVLKDPKSSILAFLFSLANTLGLLYVTALPDLTKYFQITKNQAQETITFYLLGGIFSILVFPPITKAFGRKPAIYLGGGFAILGSIVCLVSIEQYSFHLLLFGRVLTAFGAVSGIILVSTILTDSFSPAETKKKISYLMSLFILFPSIGIVLGGFISEYFSWKGCFYLMLFYTIFVIGLCSLLPETAKEKSLGHLNIVRIAKAYLNQFSYFTALLYAVISACAGMVVYLFSAEAPFIAKNRLDMPAAYYGLYNLIPNLGFFLGGVVSARVSHLVQSKTLIIYGSSVFFLFSLLMWILFHDGFINTITLFGIPFFIFFVATTIISQAQARALAASDDKAYMSSLFFFTAYLWVILSIQILHLLPSSDPSVLPTVLTSAGALMIILWLIAKKFCRQ